MEQEHVRKAEPTFFPGVGRLEGWPNTAACLPGWRSVTRQVWFFIPDGRAVPVALTGAAKLRADGISSCCSLVNVHIHPSWATSRKEGIAWYSSRPMPSLCLIHRQRKKGGSHHGFFSRVGGGRWGSSSNDSHVSRVFLFNREDRRKWMTAHKGFSSNLRRGSGWYLTAAVES